MLETGADVLSLDQKPILRKPITILKKTIKECFYKET